MIIVQNGRRAFSVSRCGKFFDALSVPRLIIASSLGHGGTRVASDVVVVVVLVLVLVVPVTVLINIITNTSDRPAFVFIVFERIR